MATTTRKSKKSEKVVETKKAVEGKIENEAPRQAVKTILTAPHLKDLEVFGRDAENAKLRMAVEEQSLQNMVLKLELLQSKIEKQKSLVASADQRYRNTVEKFDNFKKSIWPEYGLSISEPMGYDPISGEIKK